MALADWFAGRAIPYVMERMLWVDENIRMMNYQYLDEKGQVMQDVKRQTVTVPRFQALRAYEIADAMIAIKREREKVR